MITETKGPGPEPQEPPLTMTLEEIAREAQMSYQHVWRMARRGAIPGLYKLGGMYRGDRETVVAWIRGKELPQ